MTRFAIITIVASVIYTALFGGIAIFIIATNSINQNATYYDRISYLLNSDYDFKVYKPLDTQVDEVLSHPSVESVFPYYLRNATLSTEGKNTQVKAIFSYPEYPINLTEFSDYRLIASIDDSNIENALYIDQSTAISLNLNLGDEVFLNIANFDQLLFTVTRIHEKNHFYDQPTVFFHIYDQNEYVFFNESSQLNFEGIYIKSNNLEGTWNYLKNYVPYGNLLSEDYFGSQSEYELYLSNFENQDYSSQVFVKSDVLNSRIDNNRHLLERSSSLLTFSIIFLGFGYLLIALKTLYGVQFAQRIELISNNSIIKKTKYLITYVLSDFLTFIILIFMMFVFRRINANIITTEHFLQEVVSKLHITIMLIFVVNLLVSTISYYYLNKNQITKSRPNFDIKKWNPFTKIKP
ncbi:hypothetical protein [Liberiplasma polymorphum]|uniref:hypothetical protein n=1 Tax=Liberiplasma polymorphum TaxID=3374570 RepID=UPI00377130A3